MGPKWPIYGSFALRSGNLRKRYSEVDDTRSTKPTCQAGQHDTILGPVWTYFKVLGGPILGPKRAILGQFAPRNGKSLEQILRSG